MGQVRIEYDALTNVAYIYLVDEITRGMAKRTRVVEREGINLDFSGSGTLIGIEVLEARGRVPALLLDRVLLSEKSPSSVAKDVRQFPAAETRIESGPIQFGEDWPGTFIRGDHAAMFAQHLEEVLKATLPIHPISIAILQGLLSGLRSCDLTRDEKSPRGTP